jgi:hypothetical protein
MILKIAPYLDAKNEVKTAILELFGHLMQAYSRCYQGYGKLSPICQARMKL